MTYCYHCVFAHWPWNGEDTSYSTLLHLILFLFLLLLLLLFLLLLLLLLLVLVLLVLVLLILQSFEILVPFLSELLQAILSNAGVFMSTCYKYCSPGLPTTSFPHNAPSRMFTANLLCLIACHNNEWCLLFKIFRRNIPSFPF